MVDREASVILARILPREKPEDDGEEADSSAIGACEKDEVADGVWGGGGARKGTDEGVAIDVVVSRILERAEEGRGTDDPDDEGVAIIDRGRERGRALLLALGVSRAA